MNREMRRHHKHPSLPFYQSSMKRIPDRKVGKKADYKGFRNGRDGRRRIT